ncbi:MAG: hypothetical protein H6Q31_3372, partial [Bacteroidetes bacterium]|nr:hypothetical protein [Bacteroidota bacterium]
MTVSRVVPQVMDNDLHISHVLCPLQHAFTERALHKLWKTSDQVDPHHPRIPSISLTVMVRA